MVMAQLIEKPVIIKAAGTPEKIIEEYVGMVNNESQEVSIARMVSPEGWEEPGQCPEFSEYSVVLKGMLRAETRDSSFTINAGQAFRVQAGEWVRYSTPEPGGAEYLSVCLPAFSPGRVHRDA